MSMLFVLSVFLAGVLSFFSPCVFPLLPVYMGILLDEQGDKKSVFWHGLAKTLCFIAGISVIFLILGYGAGILGNVLYTAWFHYVLGVVVILLGLHQMDILQFRFLQKQKTLTFQKKSSRNGYLTALLLGITFSFGWTPCIGPVLGSVLAVAAAGGQSAVQGGFLLLFYTLGMSLPFLVLALASGLTMRYYQSIKPYLPILKKIGGGIIIVMGILLLFNRLDLVNEFISFLGSEEFQRALKDFRRDY